MSLALMTAMGAEMQVYLEQCEVQGSLQRAGLTFHEATWKEFPLVLVESGVGKVHAALCTQILIDEFSVHGVICTGSAGALTDALNIGDIVVASDCLQHDVVVDFLGLPRGQIPFTDLRSFPTDPTLRRHALDVDLSDRNVVEGRVLTGDSFVEDTEHRRQIREELDGDCVEMEGAAVGQVCAVNEIPYLVVRAISDRADGSSEVDFQDFLEDAAHASSRVVLRALETLPYGHFTEIGLS